VQAAYRPDGVPVAAGRGRTCSAVPARGGRRGAGARGRGRRHGRTAPRASPGDGAHGAERVAGEREAHRRGRSVPAASGQPGGERRRRVRDCASRAARHVLPPAGREDWAGRDAHQSGK
jgi:hypothetical protein